MYIMDQIQPSSSMPHLVQLYQASASINVEAPQTSHISHALLQTTEEKQSYEHNVNSEPSQVPLTQELQSPHIHHNQVVMQTHLQDNPHLEHSQMTVLQSSNISQSLHVLVPQGGLYNEHNILVGDVPQHFYGQYTTYPKEQHIVTKVELVDMHEEKQKKSNSNSVEQIIIEPEIKHHNRKRSKRPNPDAWACNVRKLKHQRGEAYVSRRGKYVPERKVRTTKDCLQSCKYRCSESINDTDREHIFKAFYSLNANEKKHFLLNTTERNNIHKNKHKSPDENTKRRHSFKYFFLVRAIRHTVCKNFYLGTLAISQKPVYNVHLGKSEINTPKPDGRGLSETSIHALPSETKNRVRKHIMSYKTENSKPIKQFSRKKQYLVPNLSIKQMYNMYSEECRKENELAPVKESMYRKIFKEEFNLHFRKIKPEQQLCCQCKGVIKKKC